MDLNAKLATRRGWLLRWTCAIALLAALAPTRCHGQYNSQQQQWQYQAEQQRRAMEQQMRQQQEARQQQNYQDNLRLQQQQYNQQQQQQRRTQEENGQRQRQYYTQQEEETRNRLRNQQYWSAEYDDSASDGGETADLESQFGPSDSLANDGMPSSAGPRSNSWWPISSVGWMLAWFVGGVLATAIVFRCRSLTALDGLRISRFALSQTKRWISTAVRLLGSSISAAGSWLQRRVRHFTQGVKTQLVRMIPSRQLVRWVGHLALGTSLVLLAGFALVNLLSGFAFANSEIIAGFVVVTIGFGIAVTAAWLGPWHLSRDFAELPLKSMPPVAQTPEVLGHTHENSPPPPLAIVNPIEVPSTIPSVEGARDAHPSTEDQPRSVAIPADSVGLLCCDPCRKQFNVSGQGELAFRLILCPSCGVAMRRTGDQQPSMLESERNWTPIVSAFCEHCHGLIDIPYGAIGSTISCPRCDASMFVPDKEDQVKRLQSMSHLVQA